MSYFNLLHLLYLFLSQHLINTICLLGEEDDDERRSGLSLPDLNVWSSNTEAGNFTLEP